MTLNTISGVMEVDMNGIICMVDLSQLHLTNLINFGAFDARNNVNLTEN